MNAVLCSAQFNYFPFYTVDSTEQIQLSQKCSERVFSSFLVPEDVSSAYKKQYKQQKEESRDYVKSLVKYTSMNDQLINSFVQSVFSKISAGNPDLKDYTIVLSDWPIMNAAYVGGHVIVFYVPLLSRMENESQVAAVLCHELAHGQLDHVQSGLKKLLAELYDKEFQKKMKKTMKEEFNVQEKINMLTMKFSFNTRFHSREFEKAADSLGYLFMLNSGYDAYQFESMLDVLKHIDEAPFKDSTDFLKFFTCSSDPVKTQQYKSTSIFSRSSEDKEKDEKLRDSLRTHPDCEKRKVFIKGLMASHLPGVARETDAALFKKIKWASTMETIMADFDYQYYDMSLLNSLLYLDYAKDNEFLKIMIALNVYKIYEATKNHELSDYISNYSDGNPARLNDLLYLLNSLRLSELKSLLECFYKLNVASFTNDEFTLAANYCFSKMEEDNKAEQWQNKYKSKYTNGRFISLLELDEKPGKKKKK